MEEATASEVIVSNIADFLQVASKHEHLLGTVRGVVAAASGDNITSASLGKALGIYRKTAASGKRRRTEWLQENRRFFNPLNEEDPEEEGMEEEIDVYTPLIKKPTIKRERISEEVRRFLKNWMETAFIASSNTNNVLTKKLEGEVVTSVKHHRVDSYGKLYNDLIEKLETNKVN